MIDSMTSLAFSLQSNKGIYALLLGSGVSRSAQIPTGWDIINDLIRKIAQVEQEACEPDPTAWYLKKFGEQADYSKLLSNLAKTQTERTQLLKAYFEPSQTEEEQGLKVPTPAHHAVAQLVLTGHIRVIITTNFDRLMERALEAVGIVPTVISNVDGVKGAMPLTHTNCTIIKLHGDYLDTRIKNTVEELEAYEPELDLLLDRVLDEYGLIICGWSAEWDIALRAAFERSKSRRFTLYWAARSTPKDMAKSLLDFRRGEFIPIKDADTFFQQLGEKVEALEEFNRPHPLSKQVAVATLKKYLEGPQYKIRLHDLVMQETERLFQEFTSDSFSVNPPTFATQTDFQKEFIKRLTQYEVSSETLLELIANGCFWGDKNYESYWVKVIERLSNLPVPKGTWANLFETMRRYPALLVLYTGGIGAIAAGNYSTIAKLLTEVKLSLPYSSAKLTPAALCLYPNEVIDPNQQKLISGVENSQAPLSMHLFKKLRSSFLDILPVDIKFEESFYWFEYLLALVNQDFQLRGLNGNAQYRHMGLFNWRYKYQANDVGYIANHYLEDDYINQTETLIKDSGLFNGSLEKFYEVKAFYDKEFGPRTRW